MSLLCICTAEETTQETEPKKAMNNPVNDSTESVSLNQFCEAWLEDLLQPTHSIASEFFYEMYVCVYSSRYN